VTAPERIAYGPLELNYGLLHRAAGSSRGTVVLIHGGFWRFKHEYMDGPVPLGAAIAERGWDVWEPEYRALGAGGGWPATLDDVGAAIDHLAELHDSHGLAIDAPITIGHSAGGHLAVWATTRDEARVTVRTAISLAGVLDLALGESDDLGDGAVVGFLGGSSAEHPERYAAADPARRIVADARVRIVHGEADDVVPISQAHAYVAAAASAGQDVRLDAVPGDHDVVIDPGDPSFALTLAALEDLSTR
jgi:acetyl esterase/lipase